MINENDEITQIPGTIRQDKANPDPRLIEEYQTHQVGAKLTSAVTLTPWLKLLYRYHFYFF